VNQYFGTLGIVWKILSREKLFLFLPVLLFSLGHWLLNASFCIFSGLHNDFVLQVQRRGPHVTIRPQNSWFESQPPAYISSHASITKIDTILQTQGILMNSDVGIGVLVSGIVDQEAHLMLDGAQDSQCNQEPGDRYVLISESLFREFGENRCDVSLMLLNGNEFPLIPLALISDWNQPQKKLNIFMSRDALKQQMGTSTENNLIEIHLTDLKQAQNFKASLKKLPESSHWHVSSWEDTYSETLLLFSTEQKLHFVFLIALGVFVIFALYASGFLILLRRQNSLKSLLALGMTKNLLGSQIIGIQILLLLSAVVISRTGLYLVEQYLKLWPLPLPQSLFYSVSLPFEYQPNFFMLSTALLLLPSLWTLYRARLQLLALIFVLSPLSFSDAQFSRPNPNAFFKPDLNYKEKERTGFSLLILKDHRFSTPFNSPQFSRLGFRFGDAQAQTDLACTLGQEPRFTDSNGKIRQIPFKAGKYDLNCPTIGLEEQLNITLGQTLLILAWSPHSGSEIEPVLYRAKKVMQRQENPEFRELHAILKRVREIVLDIFKDHTQIRSYLHPDYRDEDGKLEDFYEYLNLILPSLHEYSITSLLLEPRENTYHLNLMLESDSSAIELSLETDTQYLLKRYRHRTLARKSSTSPSSSKSPRVRTGKTFKTSP